MQDQSFQSTVSAVCGSNLSTFNFNGSNVRVQVINNAPMFCLADVCRVLDLEQVSRVKSRLKDDGVTTGKVIDSMGRTQDATFITEQNLYKVIFQSRKPEAEAFTDWVTGEVLPAIRKSGGYMVAKADETPEETLARALIIANDTMLRQKAQLEQQKVQIAEQSQQIADQSHQIETLTPKAAFHDAFCVSKGTVLVRDFAKQIAQALNLHGFGERVLFKFLKDYNYLNENRYPSQKAAEMGLFQVYNGFHTHNDGTTTAHHCSRITTKGQDYIYRKVKAKYDNEGRWW